MPNIVTVDKLLFWLSKNWNVLFIGRHGVGKTSMVREAFIKAGIKYRMYSAATMDPWVDFIGVPKEMKNGDGEPYLGLVKPRDFQRGEVEAVFMDEFNRAHKKIRNATMEMIQFQSINDEPLPNLRVVWAAINPYDDDEQTYDVEQLDPAQMDRFHIHVYVDYKPNRRYFQDKYGNEIASTAISWWNVLPKEQKNKVSPRRLDYALEVWSENGHLEDVLPISSNVGKLRTSLKTTPLQTKLNAFFNEHRQISSAGKSDRTAEELEFEVVEFLSDENTYESVIKDIVKKPPMVRFFVPLMPEEKISELLQTENVVRNYYRRRFSEAPRVQAVMEQIAQSGTNTSVAREFKRLLKRAKVEQVRNIHQSGKLNPNRIASYAVCKTNANFSSILETLKSSGVNDTYSRTAIYEKVADHIPEDMLLADAIATLHLLNTLIRRSHNKVLVRWLKLMGIINNCVENLQKAKWDFGQFQKEFPALSEWVVNQNVFYFEFK